MVSEKTRTTKAVVRATCSIKTTGPPRSLLVGGLFGPKQAMHRGSRANTRAIRPFQVLLDRNLRFGPFNPPLDSLSDTTNCRSPCLLLYGRFFLVEQSDEESSTVLLRSDSLRADADQADVLGRNLARAIAEHTELSLNRALLVRCECHSNST